MYGPPEIFIAIGILAIFWQLGSDLISFKIDEKKNWIMQGMIISLVLITRTYIPYIIAIGTVYILMKLLDKYETKHGIGFASGDKQIITWIIPGLTILSATGIYAATYTLILFILLMSLLIYSLALKKPMKIPGLALLTISFILTIYLYYFYPLIK